MDLFIRLYAQLHFTTREMLLINHSLPINFWKISKNDAKKVYTSFTISGIFCIILEFIQNKTIVLFL